MDPELLPGFGSEIIAPDPAKNESAKNVFLILGL